MIPKQRTRPASKNDPNWRRLPADHPVWCVLERHQAAEPHRSARVEVGHRQRGGTVTVWLLEHPNGDVRLGIGIAHMTWLVGEVNLDDARALIEGLDGLLGQV